MKKIFLRVYLAILRAYLSIYYDKKYLVGRLFDKRHYSLGYKRAKQYLRMQKKGINNNVPWPCNPTSVILFPENIDFDIDYMDNFFNNGCYFQAYGKIHIGKRTLIAQNVGIITSNHDLLNIDNHVQPKDVFIGDDCWVGMNSVILPGVVLGDHTIVGAGSVVSKSFPDGNCVIAGSPAKIIRLIEAKNAYENSHKQ